MWKFCPREGWNMDNERTPIFTGAASALITPMHATGVDFDTLGRLIDWQIDQGIDALVIAGTTGEGSTLSDAEHRQVLEYAIHRINGRVPAIATTGSNDTDYACFLTRYACSLGYDACLVVTPYYNKTTQRGLIAMYTAIAAASTKPLILYNIPGRTGVNIKPETLAELVKVPHIEAVKEASGDISQIAQEALLVGHQATLYSGNDDQIIPILSLGGKGVISVLSNLLPKQTSDMVHSYLSGDVEKAREMQIHYLPLINALFSETNPIPVKAAMAAMGWGENRVRLPLVEMSEDKKAVMLDLMRQEGLI